MTLDAPGAERVVLPDDPSLAFDRMVELGWTDGMPVIPPTPANVDAMLAGTHRARDEVLGAMPPSDGLATVEAIAINAVMAGCRPAYLPVLLAAVEAMLQPQLNLLAIQTTTNPVAPFVLINGPARRRIELNCGRGALGPGWRANATIGRAIRLIMQNIGGARAAEVDKAVLGFPGKYTFCMGELEEESPWAPYHVEHGFAREDSVVTIMACQGTQSVAASYLQPESILKMVGNGLTVWGTNSYNKGDGTPAVVLTPRHAWIFHESGWDKRRIQAHLFEVTKVPESHLPAEQRLMGHHRNMDGDRICICGDASDIAILVAGGPEAYHIGLLANYGNPKAMARIDFRDAQ